MSHLAPMPHPAHRRRVVSAVALTSAVLVLLSGCSGGEEDETSPQESLAAARTVLDETPGVRLGLVTEKLPDGVEGIVDAQGLGTHAPAFDGTITVRVNNLDLDVPVVAVEGDVYAKLPFTTSFAKINPADYGAPDPAVLMDTEAGISAWLTAATGVERTDEVRDGEDVLTRYRGTIPGDAVADVIPSADDTADFAAEFLLDGEGRLDTAEVSGPFYSGEADVDYTLSLDGYGTDETIEVPEDLAPSASASP